MTCDIDVLFPKLFSVAFGKVSFSLGVLRGVDVLNVDFDFGDDFLALKSSGMMNLRCRRFAFGRFFETFGFVRFSQEKRRFASFGLFPFSSSMGQVSDFASLLVSLNSENVVKKINQN